MVETTLESPASLQEIVQAYLDAWNADDPGERKSLLERAVSDDVEFVDPMKQLVGRDALAAHIADVRTKFAGVMFASGGELDAHNGKLRAPWIAERSGQVVLRGLDVDDVGRDGRLTRIIGFFDEI